MRLFDLIVVLALCVLTAVASFAADVLPKPVVTQYKDYERFEITLKSALPEGKDVTLHLGRHGDAGFLQGWATVPGLDRVSDALRFGELKLEDGRLSGKVVFRRLHNGTPEDLVAEFTLDAKVDGDKVTGSYSGWTASRTSQKGEPTFTTDEKKVEPHQVIWKHEKPTAVKGKLDGRTRSAAQVAEGQQFAKGQDWPQFAGPTHDFVAAPFKGELIDDMHDARLVWISETAPPARAQVERYQEGNFRRFLEDGLSGGGSSPMLADGRVYLQYFKPTGEQVTGEVQEQLDKGHRVMPDMWKVKATDVMLCLDAATGRTLWKVEIPDGRYVAMLGRTGSNKGSYAPHPMVVDGTVYMSSTRDITYALDGKTGEMKWAKQMPMPPVWTMIGGVMMPSGSDLTGYDPKTGKQLWIIEKANHRNRPPVVWSHGDKEYAIAPDGKGTVRCVDPQDGKELWAISNVGANTEGLYVVGDTLFLDATPIVPRGQTQASEYLAAYKLTLSGAEKAWGTPEDMRYSAQNKQLVHWDGLILHRPWSKKASVGMLIDIKTGKTVKKFDINAARGFINRINDKVILQRDVSHGENELFIVKLDRGKPQQQAELWHTDHSTTAGYWPLTLVHAVGDGRLIMRGAHGVICYDLRRPARTADAHDR